MWSMMGMVSRSSRGLAGACLSFWVWSWGQHLGSRGLGWHLFSSHQPAFFSVVRSALHRHLETLRLTAAYNGYHVGR